MSAFKCVELKFSSVSLCIKKVGKKWKKSKIKITEKKENGIIYRTLNNTNARIAPDEVFFR